MADQLKIEQVVTFVQESPPETYRLLSISDIKVPSGGYTYGKMTIPANTVDQKIAEDVNIFMMSSSSGVSLKIGSTTATELMALNSFSYDGSKTTIYVSNPSTEDIVINFVTAVL